MHSRIRVITIQMAKQSGHSGMIASYRGVLPETAPATGTCRDPSGILTCGSRLFRRLRRNDSRATERPGPETCLLGWASHIAALRA